MKKLIFSSVLAFSLLIPSFNADIAKQTPKPEVQLVEIIKDGMYDNHNSFVDESKYSLDDVLESVERIYYQFDCKFSYKTLSGVTISRSITKSFLGSGVVIEKRGGKAYVLTNSHVVKKDISGYLPLPVLHYDLKIYDVTEQVFVLKNGKMWKQKMPAKIIGLNEISDIALLEFEDFKSFKKFPYKIGNSDNLRIGDFVWVVGNPAHIEDYTLKGNISKLVDNEKFMIGCDIQPGYSGGAVIAIKDGEYELIGLVSAVMKRPSMYQDITEDTLGSYGFAIKINIFKDLMDDYFKKSK